MRDETFIRLFLAALVVLTLLDIVIAPTLLRMLVHFVAKRW